MSSPVDQDAFFVADGDALVPQPMAQGPWGQTVSGHTLGGLLGWAVEEHGADLQPARLTVDMLRPVFMKPVAIRSAVVRQGKRIKIVDAEMVQDGEVVSRATSVFLRRGDHPDQAVWSPAPAMPPMPQGPPRTAQDMPFELWAFGSDTENGTLGGSRTEWEQSHSRKFAWVREIRPLIAGQDISPFTRAALAADVTSALTHWGVGGLRYINVDFTLSLNRLPDGDFIGLASDGHHGDDGVASGAATVFDRHGPIGHSVAVALAQPADAFRPPRHIGLT